MKRWLIFLLVGLVALVNISLGEGVSVVQEKSSPLTVQNENKDSPSEEKEEKKQGLKIPVSSHIVSYDAESSEISIQTDSLKINLHEPFGWIWMTQSILQNTELFGYEDGISITQWMIEDENFLHFVDVSTHENSVYCSEVDLFEMSPFIRDLSVLTEQETDIVNLLLTAMRFEHSEVKKLGNHHYMIIKDLWEKSGLVLYETIIEDHPVTIWVYCSEELLPDVEDIIADMNIIAIQ